MTTPAQSGPVRSGFHLSRIMLATALACAMAGGSLAQQSPGAQPAAPAPTKPATRKASAQPSDTTSAQPTKKPAKSAGTGAGGNALADEPTRIDSVGLSFYPPEGARLETTSVGGQSSVSVRATDSTWVVNVLTPRTSKPETTPTDVCNEAIKQIAGAAGAVYQDGKLRGWKGRIIEDTIKEIVVDRNTAQRFYLEVPQGEKDPSLVRGYTVFKVGNDRFAIFDLTTTLKDFDKARGAYEMLVGTAKFENAGELAAARGAAISAGLKVMQGVNDQTLRDIVASTPERWERLYKPGATGASSDDQEIAYRRIRCWLGKRGELNSSRKPEQFRGIETQEGVLVRIDARQLVDGRIYDSQGIYFVTFDRQEETWTLSNNVRDGKERIVATETGSRNGKQMTVSTILPGDPGQTITPLIQGDGYISRVESFLLPQILIKSGVGADYGFYVYQSDTANIRMRRDDLTQEAKKNGTWTLSTRLKDDAKPMVSLFNAKGELIRIDMADGSRWEPTNLTDLVKLWRDKNLPMD